MSAVAVAPLAAPSGTRPHAQPAAIVPPAYRKRPPSALGDPSALVCTVARAALEGVLGQDVLHLLYRWVSTEVLESLQRQQTLARRTGVVARGSVHIARVRLCRVAPGAVETAVVAREGERAHPIAMRLEATHGKWLVTALDVG